MMNLRYILLVVGTFGSVLACSQSKSIVKRADAYFFVRLPGTIPVNPEGNSSSSSGDTTVLVFIETTKADIQWDEAVINRRAHYITAEKLSNRSIDIGTDKKTKRKVALKPKPNHQLWRLTFKAKLDSSLTPGNNPNLLIKASFGKKKLSIPITEKKAIMLADLPQ